jgi:predicted HTH transcriptional regulator
MWEVDEMGRVSMPLIATFIATDEMKQKVIQFIKNNKSITNKQCRLLLGLGYEQVIRLFNKMVESGELLREGKTSSVKYRMRI